MKALTARETQLQQELINQLRAAAKTKAPFKLRPHQINLLLMALDRAYDQGYSSGSDDTEMDYEGRE